MKQLSIFIENKRGAILKVMSTLKEHNIQIIASTISDTQDFGIYRIICDDPDKAYRVLKDEDASVTLSDVFAIYIDDTPGEAARVVEIFAKAGINISYMYSFLLAGKGILVFRTDNPEETSAIIKENGLNEFA